MINSSNSGVLYDNKDLFSMEGAVEIVTPDGYQLNAEKVDVKRSDLGFCLWSCERWPSGTPRRIFRNQTLTNRCA